MSLQDRSFPYNINTVSAVKWQEFILKNLRWALALITIGYETDFGQSELDYYFHYFFKWVLNDNWLQIYPFMIEKCKYIYNNDHRYTGWKCTPSGFVAVEMDGTFVIIFVQCFVGVTSLLAQQATQFIMVSGNFLSLLFISPIPIVFIYFSISIFFSALSRDVVVWNEKYKSNPDRQGTWKFKYLNSIPATEGSSYRCMLS